MLEKSKSEAAATVTESVEKDKALSPQGVVRIEDVENDW